jgi:hypothetical protein
MKSKRNILTQILRVVKAGSRGLQNRKLCALLLSVIIVGILTLSPTFSSLMNTVVISSTGRISLSSISAKSGSPADIQTAVNVIVAAGGGTVYIPVGDWRCDQAPGGAVQIDLETLPSGAWLNIIGSYTNVTTTQQNGYSITCPATILRSTVPDDGNLASPISTFNIIGSATGSGNLNNYKSQNRHIRISGLTILGNVTGEANVSGYSNTGISLSYVDGFRIDNCWIDSNSGSDIGVGDSKGVIDHTTITDYYHKAIGGQWGYGVQVGGNSMYWKNGYGTSTWITNLSQVIGKYDWQGINITYENSQVYMYNTLYGTNYTTTNQTTTSISYTAGPVYIENNWFSLTRHVVASSGYGYYVFRYNYVKDNQAAQEADVHGAGFPSGRGAEIYNNTFNGGHGNYAVWFRGGGGVIFNNLFNHTYVGIQLSSDGYTAADLGDPEYCNDVWIWNNTYVGTSVTLSLYNNVTPGVNVFYDSEGGLTATSPAPPRPGYTPYTYPNLLALQNAGS